MKSKKEEGTKKCVIKGKLKSEDYKIFLEASQLENKIIHLNNNKNDVKSQKITKNLLKKNNIILNHSKD